MDKASESSYFYHFSARGSFMRGEYYRQTRADETVEYWDTKARSQIIFGSFRIHTKPKRIDCVCVTLAPSTDPRDEDLRLTRGTLEGSRDGLSVSYCGKERRFDRFPDQPRWRPRQRGVPTSIDLGARYSIALDTYTKSVQYRSSSLPQSYRSLSLSEVAL